MYRSLEPPVGSFQIAPWDSASGDFHEVVGYSYFGDFFLRDPKTGQYALLFPFTPEIVPLELFDPESFTAFLGKPNVADGFLRPKDLEALKERLGPLDEDQIYIPEPYPFIGEQSELESYTKGDVWVFARTVGTLHGLGSEEDDEIALSVS